MCIQFGELFNLKKYKKMKNMLLDKDLKLAQKYMYNQTKNNMKDYHFDKSGSTFNFSYSPMYTQNYGFWMAWRWRQPELSLEDMGLPNNQDAVREQLTVL